MPNAPHPDAVVLRFSPMSPAGLLAKAEREARRSDGPGLHAVSVWADHAREGESREDVIDRLLEVTELEGCDPKKNTAYWWCSTAQELVDLEFSFTKEDWMGEPAEHYAVILGFPPGIADAQRFVDAFTREKR
jgi:hypothetical protein